MVSGEKPLVCCRTPPLMLAVAPVFTRMPPLLLLSIVLVNARLDAVATELRTNESAVFQIVQRSLSAIRVVQAFFEPWDSGDYDT